MTALRLYLFGPPRMEYLGVPVRIERRKALALAAYLALSQQPVSRDVAADLLWPELDYEHARSSLRSAVRSLTAAVPIPWIRADRTALVLDPAVWVDVNAFTGLLSRADAHTHVRDEICGECATWYGDALGLYRSDFLSGFYVSASTSYEDWQRTQTEWLRRELGALLWRLAAFEAGAGRAEAALTYARRWLALDELHEPAVRLLMQLLAATGQRTEALRQYQQCVELLDRELASPPEEETVRLAEAIQANRTAKIAPEFRAGATGVSLLPPLPALIVGREEALHALKRRLGITADRRLVTAIQGWPGVGKSTIVALLAHDQEIARQFPDGILWVSLGERPDVFGALAAWAEALHLGDARRARGPEEISAQLTAALKDRRVLLIVDDVWQSEHAALFRVGGQHCALVMTSRLNDTARALAPTAEDIYRLPVLSEAAGLDLLSRLTPTTVAEYPDEARALVRDLEGLPLAIHVAGRLLQSEVVMGWGVRELLAELRTGSALLEAEAPSEMLGSGRETSPTIATLLRRSTDLLDAATRFRFAYLGLFLPKPATFDLAAMAAAWDVPDPKPTVRALVNRGLLEPVSGGRFRMHALLVAHASALLAEDEGR